MVYRVLADVVVLVHLGFVLFAVLGGLLALRWKRCPRIHLPAVAWAVAIEFGGWICPLTPLASVKRGRGERAPPAAYLADIAVVKARARFSKKVTAV